MFRTDIIYRGSVFVISCAVVYFLGSTIIFVLLVEVLDEKDFGQASESNEYNEDAINPAKLLGLFVSKPITSV